MPKLHNVSGRDFRSLDPDADPPRDVLIPVGGSAEVSDDMAKRLLADFPKRLSKTAPKAAATDDPEGGE